VPAETKLDLNTKFLSETISQTPGTREFQCELLKVKAIAASNEGICLQSNWFQPVKYK